MSYTISVPNDKRVRELEFSQSDGALHIIIKQIGMPDIQISITLDSGLLWDMGDLLRSLADDMADNESNDDDATD